MLREGYSAKMRDRPISGQPAHTRTNEKQPVDHVTPQTRIGVGRTASDKLFRCRGEGGLRKTRGRPGEISGLYPQKAMSVDRPS